MEYLTKFQTVLIYNMFTIHTTPVFIISLKDDILSMARIFDGKETWI
jgi:hypothetical protein